jgi:hypothetical protein
MNRHPIPPKPCRKPRDISAKGTKKQLESAIDRLFEGGIRCVSSHATDPAVLRRGHNRDCAAHRQSKYTDWQSTCFFAAFQKVQGSRQVIDLKVTNRAEPPAAVSHSTKVEQEQINAVPAKNFDPGP